MSVDLIKFPTIRDYSAVCKYIKERTQYVGRDKEDKPIFNPGAVLPTVKFRGTIKVHGTNAAITLVDDKVYFQSRERVLSMDQDHFDLMATYSPHVSRLKDLFNRIRFVKGLSEFDTTSIAIFGEWAGDRIQTKAAIAILPKMFVVFAIKVGEEWQKMKDFNFVCDKEIRIFNIGNFPTYHIEIDMNRAKLFVNEMAELTSKVEAECPFAKDFGIVGIGEGIVWTPEDGTNPDMTFKVKGQKHSNTKVKVLNLVDKDELQRHYEFVDKVTNEPRLEQGLHNLIHEQLKPFDMASMGLFIRWVYADIIKEEQELMEENNIDPAKIGKAVSDICKTWYVTKLNEAERSKGA